MLSRLLSIFGSKKKSAVPPTPQQGLTPPPTDTPAAVSPDPGVVAPGSPPAPTPPTPPEVQPPSVPPAPPTPPLPPSPIQ